MRASLRALVVCLSTCAAFAAPAGAAPAIVPTPLGASIAAQPLSQALIEFSQQTSIQLVYVSRLAIGRMSRGAPAGVSGAEALSRLLEGTGLHFEFLNPHLVRLVTELPARAQRDTASDSGWMPPRLDEVVVTAAKREEALVQVPMSMGVLSAQDMDAAGVRDISAVAAATPAIEYDFSTQFGSGTLTNIAIRGITAQNGSSTTGIYIDDVPIHVRHTPFANPYPITFDLARVEVLRGPQGTLFGAGTAGGAIRFITSEPSVSDASGLYRAEICETRHGDGSFEVGAAAGAPLVQDRLGVRASAWYRRDGGYIDRVSPFTGAVLDKDANSTSSGMLRAGFAVTPAAFLRITPSFTWQSLSIHDSPSFYTYLSDPGAGILRNGKLLRQPAVDRFSLASLKVEAQLQSAVVTAVTAWFDRTAAATVDQTNVAGAVFYGGFGNPLGPAYPTSYADAVATGIGAHQILFSQEVRLASRDLTAPLSWLTGVFYRRAREQATRVTYAVTSPQVIGIYSDDYDVSAEQAAFGQATVRFSRRWSLSLGARVARTEEDLSQHAGGVANGGAAPGLRIGRRQISPLVPRLAVSYQPDDRNLFYATLAKGFRAGATVLDTIAHCQGVAVRSSHAPDSVWSYEAGAKNVLFDRRLQLAASAFYVEWDGIRERELDACGDSFDVNAGRATSTGFDLAADALLGERVHLVLALGYVDVHYTRTVAAGSSIIVDRGTVVGGVPSVPAPWIARASVEYRLPLGNTVQAYVRAEDIVHTRNPGPFTESDPRAADYDPTAIPDPATNQLNLRLGAVRSGLDLRLSLNNALNSQPTLQRASDLPGSTLYYAYTLRPRTLALTATQRF